MSRCIDTPISWLRLEQLALGELDGAAGARAHLEACAACRAAFASIEADRRQLRPLRLEVIRPRRRWLRWGTAGSALVAAAAAVILFAAIDRDGERADRVAIKGGGELVVSLVRERDGRVDESPDSFTDGDRLKVAITCTEPGPVMVAVAVSQGGELFFPLGRRVELWCGNRALVPGAFSATGDAPITVCVRPEPGDDAACVDLPARR
jgi:hypothetical protein